MNIKLTYSKKFKKRYSSLNDKEKKQLQTKLKIFTQNPKHPSLRTHKIQGTVFWEFSVNMDIRVVWFYENNELIALVDIGHHDILDKY